MKLSEIKNSLSCHCIYPNTCDGDVDIDVQLAYASDLMSDILLAVKPGALLLTGLTNHQVIRTGKVAGVGAIVFVRGKKPTADTVKLAEHFHIPLLATQLSMFDVCGILFTRGVRGISFSNGSPQQAIKANGCSNPGGLSDPGSHP